MMYIKVHVFPESDSELVQKISEDTYAISVREKPLNNMANRRVFALLEKTFGTGKIKLVKGGTMGHKIFQIG